MSVYLKVGTINNKIREYCDNRGITCGTDDRRMVSDDIIKYVFCRPGSPGVIVEIHLSEIKSVHATLFAIYDHLNREFPEDISYEFVEYGKRVPYIEVKSEISEYKWRSKYNIEKVIFNNPATIVFWEDGTKTVVKRQKGDRWDKEKGIAMAIAKKLYGNTGKYCDILKEHLEG